MRRSGRTHQLSEEAQNLYQVARQGDGIVHHGELEQGHLLQVNGRPYITDQDSKEVQAKKVTALRELVDASFLVQEDYDPHSGLLTFKVRE